MSARRPNYRELERSREQVAQIAEKQPTGQVWGPLEGGRRPFIWRHGFRLRVPIDLPGVGHRLAATNKRGSDLAAPHLKYVDRSIFKAPSEVQTTCASRLL
jgi:hypothetical protein